MLISFWQCYHHCTVWFYISPLVFFSRRKRRPLLMFCKQIMELFPLRGKSGMFGQYSSNEDILEYRKNNNATSNITTFLFRMNIKRTSNVWTVWGVLHISTILFVINISFPIPFFIATSVIFIKSETKERLTKL